MLYVFTTVLSPRAIASVTLDQAETRRLSSVLTQGLNEEMAEQRLQQFRNLSFCPSPDGGTALLFGVRDASASVLPAFLPQHDAEWQTPQHLAWLFEVFMEGHGNPEVALPKVFQFATSLYVSEDIMSSEESVAVIEKVFLEKFQLFLDDTRQRLHYSITAEFVSKLAGVETPVGLMLVRCLGQAVVLAAKTGRLVSVAPAVLQITQKPVVAATYMFPLLSYFQDTLGILGKDRFLKKVEIALVFDEYDALGSCFLPSSDFGVLVQSVARLRSEFLCLLTDARDISARNLQNSLPTIAQFNSKKFTKCIVDTAPAYKCLTDISQAMEVENFGWNHPFGLVRRGYMGTVGKVLQYMMRFEIPDLAEVLHGMEPSKIVHVLLSPHVYADLSWNEFNGIILCLKNLESYLADVFPFLSHFVMLATLPPVFKRYMDMHLGKGAETSIDRGRLSLITGVVEKQISVVRMRLFTLSRSDAIPREDLDLVATLLSTAGFNADVEIGVGSALQQYFSGAPVTYASASFVESKMLPTVRISILRRVLRQLEVVDLVNSMSVGLEKHGLGELMQRESDAVVAALLELVRNLRSNQGAILLSSVKPDSEHTSIFQSMTPAALELLRTCGQYAELKRWLVDMKFVDWDDSKEGTKLFNKSINHVTQLLQGQSYDGEVLSALMESHHSLDPFLSPDSFSTLVCSIKDFDAASLTRLKLVEENLSHIQDWFDDNVSNTYGEVITELKSIMDGGRAVIKTDTVLGATLSVEFSVTRQTRVTHRVKTEAQLREFIQAVIFHSSEGDAGTSDDIARFQVAVECLYKLRTVIANLYTEVHLNVVNEDEPILVANVAFNQRLYEAYSGELKARCAQLKSLRLKYPLLSFLVLPQMLKWLEILELCRSAFAVEDNLEELSLPPVLREELLQYLRLCGLPAEAVDFNRECFGDELMFEVDVGAVHIERLGKWLHKVKHLAGRTMLIPASSCAQVVGCSRGEVGMFAVDVLDGSPVDVYRTLSGLYSNQTPHCSQVLLASEFVTAAALDIFFERCCSHVDAVFTLIAPHLLPVVLWESLTTWMQHFIHGSGGLDTTIRGRLVLLFTKDCSMRRLCVNHATVPSTAMLSLNFRALEMRAYVGPSGCGKSFQIQKRLKESPERHVVVIRVNEGFSVDSMVERLTKWAPGASSSALLDAFAASRPVTFVFHVSTYAPFPELDAFLFQFLVMKNVMSASGEVVFLPEDLDIEVLVEIPNPLDTHDDIAGKKCPCVECVKHVSHGISFNEANGCSHLMPLLFCMPVVFREVPSSTPFEVQPEQVLALRMLKAYTIPLPSLDRPFVGGKLLLGDQATMGNSRCASIECGGKPRFVIDTVAVVVDRPDDCPSIKLVTKETQSVSFQSAGLDVANVQQFFVEELSKWFSPALMSTLASSKRQMTCFLSYMANVAKFWHDTVFLTSNTLQLHLGSTLFEQMVMRALDLCDRELRRDWKTFPHQFLMLLNSELLLLTAFGMHGFVGGVMDGSRKGLRGTMTPSHQMSEPCAMLACWDHSNVLVVKSPSPAELSGNSAGLLRQLAAGFNMDETVLRKVLTAHKYILTFDFVMKMLHIQERRRALVPTIIEGETGVGKTKLLSVYAAIDAERKEMQFDSVQAMRAAVSASLQLRPPQALILEKMRVKKMHVELDNHGVSMSSVIEATAHCMTEYRFHAPELTGSLFDAVNAALEGCLYWDPLFNGRQLLFFMRTLLVLPPGRVGVDLDPSLAGKNISVDTFLALHTVSMERTQGTLMGLWKNISRDDMFAMLAQSDDEVLLAIKALSAQVRTLLMTDCRQQAPAPSPDDDADKVPTLSVMASFIRWLSAWLFVRPVPSFHTILMHAAYTDTDLQAELLPVLEFSKKSMQCCSETGKTRALLSVVNGGFSQSDALALLSSTCRSFLPNAVPPSFVVFLDEVNTSSVLGSVQDVMMDHCLEGTALPDNIFWVCATNPYKTRSSLGDARGDCAFRDHYQVRPVPEAMESVKWDFGALTAEAEHDYIGAKIVEIADTTTEVDESVISLHGEGSCEETACTKCRSAHWECELCKMTRYSCEITAYVSSVAGEGKEDDTPVTVVDYPMRPSDEDLRCMTDMISSSQCFVRDREGCSAVSQRDLQRVFRALRFFWNHLLKRDVKNMELLETEKGRSGLLRKAVCLAAGLVYFLRLSDDGRAALDATLQSVTSKYGSPLSVAHIIREETTLYVRHIKLESGTAQNTALKENVFAIIVCIQLQMPLIIIGPPGSSKTMSFQIVAQTVLNDAMVREDVLKTDGGNSFFAGFLSVEAGVFHYQCSELSTSNEVKSVFNRAIQRQNGWDRAAASRHTGTSRRTAVVFMDEAGLPEEAKESLKVLHYYLDDPKVAFVAITNRPLDAAKMNRAVVLFRPAADQQELSLLMAGSLGEPPEMVSSPSVRAFTNAYYSLMCKRCPLVPGGKIVFRERYGLRDFYNFGRYFAHAQAAFPPCDADILCSLERNFNGVTRQEFQSIVSAFFYELGRDRNSVCSASAAQSRLQALYLRTQLSTLTEALKSGNIDPSRMNETIVRYKLVLDETDDDSATRLLFQCGLLHRESTLVYDLSNFPDDDNDVIRSTLICNIKHAMVHGKTVLLMHTGPIHGSLYDLLNQHFSKMEKREGLLYYANIAIGSYSRPCQVHHDFRLIVHMATHPAAPAPFYNRFEKYLVTVEGVFEDMLEDPSVHEYVKDLFLQSKEVVEKLIEQHILPSGFVGLVPKSTLTSVLLSTFLAMREKRRIACRLAAFLDAMEQEGDAAGSSVVEWAKLGFGVRSDSDPVIDINVRRESLVNHITDRMLRIATPEAVFLARKSVPGFVMDMYLNQQEHFDLPKLLLRPSITAMDTVPFPELNEMDGVCDAVIRRPVTKIVALTRLADGMDVLIDSPPSGNNKQTHPSYAGKFLAVMTLSKVRSQKSCTEYIKAFLSSDNACTALLIPVDIRAVGLQRVNALREIIDAGDDLAFSSHIDRMNAALAAFAAADRLATDNIFQVLDARFKAASTGFNKRIVVCIYIPPTWTHSRNAYPALFLHNWDFVYLDSHSERSGAISAQNWMKVACDLEPSLPAECAASLQALNSEVLQKVAVGVTGDRNGRHFKHVSTPGEASFVAMEPFYMLPSTGFATVADRLRSLQLLESVMGGETLSSLLAPEFLALFDKQDLLVQLNAAVQRCCSGEATSGLTYELNRHLRSLYDNYAKLIYSKAAVGYSLQSLYSMYGLYGTPENMPMLYSFTRLALTDLVPVTLSDLSDVRIGSVRCAKRWEWYPLPFLGHMMQAARSELSAIKTAGLEEVDSVPSRSRVTSVLQDLFPHLLRGGHILQDSMDENARNFIQQLFLQSFAWSMCNHNAPIFDHASRYQTVQCNAVESYASLFLRNCVPEPGSLATLFVFESSPKKTHLQRQLMSLATLEQVGMISASVVNVVTSDLPFLTLDTVDSDFVLDVALEENANILLRALWGMLVGQLWGGLCRTFGAWDELKKLEFTAAHIDALTPGKWADSAQNALRCLDPVRQQLGNDDSMTDAHKVIVESIKVIAPLAVMLFPADEVEAFAAPPVMPSPDRRQTRFGATVAAAEAAFSRKRSKKGTVAASVSPYVLRRECIQKLITLVRMQLETHIGTGTLTGSLRYLSMFEGALQMLPTLKSNLPPKDLDGVNEFLERVFVDGCAQLCRAIQHAIGQAKTRDGCTHFLHSFQADVRVMLSAFNGQKGITLPQAFCSRLLRNLMDAFPRESDAKSSIEKTAWEWLKVSLELEMSSVFTSAPFPKRYKDMFFVPDWFQDAKTMGMATSIPTHPTLTCPLARSVFSVLLNVEMGSNQVPDDILVYQHGRMRELDATLMAKVKFPSKPSNCGLMACISAAIGTTVLLEAIVSGFCTEDLSDIAEDVDPSRVLALSALRHARIGRPALREYINTLLADMPAQLYIISRAVERKGREYVTRVLHHPSTLEVLGEWVSTFRVVYPSYAVGEVTDVVQASLAGQDFLSQMPFMWPRPLLTDYDTEKYLFDDPTDASAYQEFYARTITDFHLAHAAFEASGSRACVKALRESGWLSFVTSCAGGKSSTDNDPRRLQTKMFLFCVIAWTWFNNSNTEKRRCHAVACCLDDVKSALNLDVKETVLFGAFADPEKTYNLDPDRRDDIHTTFFSSDAMEAQDRQNRGIILGTIASVLGLPRGSHVFYTNLFSPGDLTNTYGVGSYKNSPIGGIHYDCGTVLIIENGTWSAYPPRDSIADRAVFSSLFIPCFGVLAVGLYLFPQEHVRCFGPVFSRFYDSEERNFGRNVKHHPRDANDWLINFVYTRVYAASAIMANFVIESADERIVTLMSAVSSYRHAVLESGETHPVFTTTAAREEFELMWRDKCYRRSFDRRAALLDRMESTLTQSNLVRKMSLMRSCLPSKVNPVGKLIAYVDKCAASGTAQYGMLKHLESGTASMNALAIIPDLVSLYEWLYDNLGYVLTMEDGMKPMSQIFEMLFLDGRTRQIAQRMHGMYATLCVKWNALYDEVEGALDVGACRNSQRFVKISMDTPVGTFLTYPDLDTNDILIKVLDMLVKRQNEFLTRCRGDESQNVVGLSSVVADMLLQDVSLPFASCVGMYSLNTAEIALFPHSVLIQCPFMIDRILHMARMLVGSKPILETPETSLMKPFPFRAVVAPSSHQAVASRLPAMFSNAFLTEEDIGATLQRLSSLSADAEKAMFDFLSTLTELVERIVDGVMSEAKRLVVASNMSLTSSEVVHALLLKEFPEDCTLLSFTQAQGMEVPVSDPAIRHQCETVILSKPVTMLVPMLDVLQQRISGFSYLFARFPGHIKTPVPEEIKDRFKSNLGEGMSQALAAVNELVRLLEDDDMEEAVINQSQLDTFSMRDGLRDVLMSLDMSIPLHAIIYDALPPELMMRAHYAETLQVWCYYVCLFVCIFIMVSLDQQMVYYHGVMLRKKLQDQIITTASLSCADMEDDLTVTPHSYISPAMWNPMETIKASYASLPKIIVRVIYLVCSYSDFHSTVFVRDDGMKSGFRPLAQRFCLGHPSELLILLALKQMGRPCRKCLAFYCLVFVYRFLVKFNQNQSLCHSTCWNLAFRL